MSWFRSHSATNRCFQTVAILGCANMEHLPHPMSTTLQKQSGYISMPGGGAGAYYRKGDHLQKKKTGNTPVEFKALRMFPEWERWIVPKPTFLSKSLLKEAATLEEKGESKNRVQRHNIFEHYKEDFQPHTLTVLPSMIQAFKEYRERVAFGNPAILKKGASGKQPSNTMQTIPCLMTAGYTMQSPLVKITQVINLGMMKCQATSQTTMTSDSATTRK